MTISETASADSSGQTVKFTREDGRTIKSTDMARKPLRMGTDMREIGRKVRNTDTEKKPLQTGIGMRESFSQENTAEKEHIITPKKTRPMRVISGTVS